MEENLWSGFETFLEKLLKIKDNGDDPNTYMSNK